jgi:hypothetical protein
MHCGGAVEHQKFKHKRKINGFDSALFTNRAEQTGTATERECRAVMNTLSEKRQ